MSLTHGHGTWLNENMTDTSNPVPDTDATPKDWFATHCYHCGRLNEDIIIDGPTEGCLCDAGQDPPLSTIESETLREAN